MEYSPTLCFADFEYRRSKSNKKRGIKLAKAEMSRHNFRMSRHNLNKTSRSYVATRIAMSQQEFLCRNKNCYVVTRLKLNLRLEVSSVATFHNFVVTQNEKN